MISADPLRLTAIICNFNHAAYLPQALRAMLDSQCPPDELVVVDDGSTDHSRKIIEEFAAGDPRIRVIWHERNQGWHAASAHALDIATGSWIYSGAADDYVLPGFFAHAIRTIQQYPAAGIVCGAVRKISPEGRLVEHDAMADVSEPVFFSPQEYGRYICRPDRAWHSFSPASIVRREAIAAAGGYRRELGYWADSFVIRVAGLRWGMAYFPEDAVCFRVLTHGISATNYRNVERQLQIIRAVERLMRSPEFIHDFPTGYADWWRSKATFMIRSAYADQMDLAFAPVIDRLMNPPPGTLLMQRGQLWLCRKVLSAAYRFTRFWTVSAQTAVLLRRPHDGNG